MKKKYVIWLIIAILGLGSTSLTSCGSMRSYWGVEGDYDFDDGYYYKKKKKSIIITITTMMIDQ
ncbi:hypothetical protein [uncultured Muribaculum sp.]|uniref:hypothetical protein n=1 Tax=uncultured Muribaculum sp. TaxID=1918613 RepID=UPI0027314193|nr:hypothetical protein [uncultured Muribaculum sp.]